MTLGKMITVTKQYNLVPAKGGGWEGDLGSGVALAMCHRLSGIPTYGLNGLRKGDEHHAYTPVEYSKSLI